MTEEYEYPDDLDQYDYPQWHEWLYETLQQFDLADKPRLMFTLERFIRELVNSADAKQLSHLRHENGMLHSRIQEANRQIQYYAGNNYKMMKLIYRIHKENPKLVERMEAMNND